MVKPWQRIASTEGPSFRVFSIRTDRSVSPRTGKEHDFYIIESQDWVNVIPLTSDQQVVMIRQYRHGAMRVTLEIPGGLIDAGDSPAEAASRELREETGYEGERLSLLGRVNPNPALFGNRCYTFLAENVTQVSLPTPDQTEDIEVVLLPLADIPRLIREGQIDHAIVIQAFCLYFLERGLPSHKASS
jgi:ADP-ribose pyrophosphatase